jgi:hypothetical protein
MLMDRLETCHYEILILASLRETRVTEIVLSLSRSRRFIRATRSVGGPRAGLNVTAERKNFPAGNQTQSLNSLGPGFCNVGSNMERTASSVCEELHSIKVERDTRLITA